MRYYFKYEHRNLLLKDDTKHLNDRISARSFLAVAGWPYFNRQPATSNE